MKTLKTLFLLACTCTALSGSAQTGKAQTAKIIQAQNYIFSATTALPLNAADISKILNRMPGSTGGGSINLSGSGYELRVTTDSLVAYLPYYGRSYTPRMGSSDDSGIKFNAKKFSYTLSERKKGGWLISLKTKDLKENYSMTLTVTTTGYGSLTVNNNNQQPITFSGYLSGPLPKKEN